MSNNGVSFDFRLGIWKEYGRGWVKWIILHEAMGKVEENFTRNCQKFADIHCIFGSC